MSVLDFLLPWDSQPQEIPSVDFTNPINDRLAFEWNPLRPELPGVGLPLTPTNAARAVARDGVVSRLTVGYWLRSNYGPVVTSDGGGNGDFTVVVRANPSASATQQALVSQRRASGSFEQFGIIANSTDGGTSASGAIEYFTFAGTLVGGAHSGRVDGKFHTWAMRRIGATVSFWEDGVQLSSDTDTVQNVYHSTSSYAIGLSPPSFAACSCDFSFQWSSNRGLSDKEMIRIGSNPLHIYNAQKIEVLVSVGGPASVAIPLIGRGPGMALAGNAGLAGQQRIGS